MAPADTMFLFEIIVEELTSFVNCSEFYIKGQFADVFNVHLKDPNEQELFLPKWPEKQKHKRKIKKTKNGKDGDRPSTAATVQTGQTILFAINVDTLISNMKQYPMELSLWSKVLPDYKIGSTHIPWSAPYYEYLNKLHRRQGQQPICVTGDYNVFDEVTSKRMAVIKLNVKLRHFKDKITTQIGSISQETQQTVMSTGLNSKPVSVLSSMIKDRSINLSEEIGTIKTIYSDGKRKPTRAKKRSIKKKETKSIDDFSSNKERVTEVTSAEVDSNINNSRLNSRIITLVRSDRNLDKNPTVAVIKSKSCPSIDQRNTDIISNYIFGDKPAGPFGNQVYCVSYFTVEHDFTQPSPQSESPKTATPSSVTSKSPKSEKSEIVSTNNSKSDKSDQLQDKARYKIRICKSECANVKKTAGLPGIQSSCSLDLPEKASHFISVKKCNDIKCGFGKMRQVPTPPDDRIFLDLSTRRAVCCDLTEKVEQVIAGMTAKMKFGSEPCYCECECQFGFMKKTTYCEICGGFERFGEDHGRKPGYELPFPCPIFHKLTEKNKMKVTASGSDTKSKKEKPESEKEDGKKKKKKKIDSRFKFNYGYTGIPPHIGHSRCALPCVGTLNAVPKRMGWLWSCENVPGMKVAQGWKPGAISNRLLKKLNKAKRQTQPEQRVKPTKKTNKKRVEDKPTLIICKRNGEYRVEMQASPEDSDVNVDQQQCSPLVYRISREDNEDRIQKRLRKRRRIVKEAVDKVWVDPYHPEICEKTCLRAYKEAIGLSNPNNPECTCSEEEEEEYECSCCNGEEDDDDSSDCSSLDLEWEIHFSPPIATQA